MQNIIGPIVYDLPFYDVASQCDFNKYCYRMDKAINCGLIKVKRSRKDYIAGHTSKLITENLLLSNLLKLYCAPHPNVKQQNGNLTTFSARSL